MRGGSIRARRRTRRRAGPAGLSLPHARCGHCRDVHALPPASPSQNCEAAPLLLRSRRRRCSRRCRDAALPPLHLQCAPPTPGPSCRRCDRICRLPPPPAAAARWSACSASGRVFAFRVQHFAHSTGLTYTGRQLSAGVRWAVPARGAINTAIQLPPLEGCGALPEGDCDTQVKPKLGTRVGALVHAAEHFVIAISPQRNTMSCRSSPIASPHHNKEPHAHA